MLIRFRCSDGMFRVEVEESSTLQSLAQKFLEVLYKKGVHIEDLKISQNPRDSQGYTANDENKSLTQLGFNEGELLYAKYKKIENNDNNNNNNNNNNSNGDSSSHSTSQTDVENSNPNRKRVKSTLRERRKPKKCPNHGPNGSCVKCLAIQNIHIESQEKSKLTSVSFSNGAAQNYASYAVQQLGLTIQRCGYLYGTVDEEGGVKVEVVYEPKQEGTKDSIGVIEDEQEELIVQRLSETLGLKQVGWINTHNFKEPHLTSSELLLIGEFHKKLGPDFVTVIVTANENGETNFEAFEASALFQEYYSEGVFDGNKTQDKAILHTTEPVLIQRRSEVMEVGVEFFYNPVAIQAHNGSLRMAMPMTENRIVTQTPKDFAQVLNSGKGAPLQEVLRDFHALLYLAKNLDPDTALLVAALVAARAPIDEGYKILIEAVAGIA